MDLEKKLSINDTCMFSLKSMAVTLERGSQTKIDVRGLVELEAT
jgi:hypothetical protein